METVLNLEPIVNLTREKFYQLCLANPDVSMERSPKGELITMSPIGGEGGRREAYLIAKVGMWNEQTQLGVVFSSQTIFSLPGGGDRAPDVAWVEKQRWENLTQEAREGFPPLCPDFAIELRSRSDRLQPLREKMQEYLASGLRLGWLINPNDGQVEIYRSRTEQVEARSMPTILSGEDILPGFELSLDLNQL